MIRNKKISIITLGCKANKYESDSMADKLTKAGACIVDGEEEADVYIINTCSVTNVAEKKSRQMMRRAKKKNPEAIVVAAGCYVNAAVEKIEQMDFVDIMVGNNLKKDIVEVLEQYFTKAAEKTHYIDINKTNEYEEMGCLSAETLNHQRAYIKISDGCNQFCSYCLIPYTRGRVRSRNPENILFEIRRLAEEGVKEFVLTGIHISSYGSDFVMNEDGQINNLSTLILQIAEIPKVERIRLGSLEPRIITKEFLDCLKKCDKVCRHFHLSLQSGCNETLRRMNRKYTIEEFEEKCRLLRDYFKNPAITTDVIVGFPGETEEEFETTYANLKRINLYQIHVFKYSVRTGTVAEKLPYQITEEVKTLRSNRLLELTAMQKEEYERLNKGKSEYVLIEEVITKEEAEGLPYAVLVKESSCKKMNTGDTGMLYAGHTGNYIKVAVKSKTNIINQMVEVIL